MKIGLSTLGLGLALVAGGGFAAAQVNQSGLYRLSPTLEDFDAEGWRQKLCAADLEQREQDFARLAELALHQHEAREVIEQWSRDSDGDLAWTARLLLRELASRSPQHPHTLFSPGRGGSFFDDPFGLHSFEGFRSVLPQDLEERLRHQMNELRSLQQQLGQGAAGASAAESRRARVQTGPDGVTVTIVEEVDGQQQSHEYRSESLEKLLQDHPELRDRIGMDLPLGDLGGLKLFFDSRAGGRAPQSGLRTDVLGVGVSPISAEERQRLGLADGVGLHVDRTTPGTIAEQLGLQRGQILVELNGKQLGQASDITEALCERAEGGEIKVRLFERSGQERVRSWKPGNSTVPAAPTPLGATETRRI